MHTRLIQLLPVTGLVMLMLIISGCGSLAYYVQSANGQWELMAKRRDIQDVITDPDTPPALRTRLRAAREIRTFATQALALPDNDSYRSYADLQRPYAVWNVFAAAPFDTRLMEWCFTVAGCVSYKGFFTEAKAQAFARELQDQGLETYVAGVAAYSTLGWFDDPLLNTVMHRSEARLAGMMFHELAHQELYVKGDTAFNEAFATTVELVGVRRWLAQRGALSELQADALHRQRQEAFVDLVTRARDRLAMIYQTDMDETQKRRSKHALQRDLRRQYQGLKHQWGGYDGYDDWFAQDLNNAQLGAVTTYRDHVPALQALLAREGGSLPAFYAACRKLAELPQAQRLAALAELSAGSVATVR